MIFYAEILGINRVDDLTFDINSLQQYLSSHSQLVFYNPTEPCSTGRRAISALANEFASQIAENVIAEGSSPEDSLCIARLPDIVTDSSAGFVTRKMGDTLSPHGSVVKGIIDDLAGRYGDPVYSVEVDTDAFTWNTIVEKINQQVLPSPETNFVINMSFNVVACGDLADLAAYEAFVRASDDAGELVEAQKALSLLFPPPQAGDFPLTTCMVNQLAETGGYSANLPSITLSGCDIATLPIGPHVIAVSSAGNLGYPYPLWPAGWQNVVSVSASPERVDFYSTPPRDNLSDSGNVLMPGLVLDSDGRTTLEILGTSFAAPRLSYLLGRYLAANGSDICLQTNGFSSLAYGSWDNLTVPEAVSNYCSAIPLP